MAEQFEKIELNLVEDVESMLKIVRMKRMKMRKMRKKQSQKKQMMRRIGWANLKMVWAENLDTGMADNMDIVNTVGIVYMEQIADKRQHILIVVI